MKRTSIIRVLAGALFCLALAHSKGAGAACTAVPKTVVKARLSISADDRADIYINGRFFARTPSLYSYTSVYNYPVPLGWLNPGMGNVIAVTNYDLHSGDMGTAYKLLITYSDGSFDEIISDPAQFPILYYYDGYNTPGPLSFPPNVAGLPWYAVNYSPGAGWNPALAYTPACFGGWASIPYSGGTVPWMGSVPCNTVNSYQTWSFRQFFPICSFPTPTLTPTPSPSRTPPPCVYTVNLNAGGPSFFDSGGGFWYADQAYSPGGFGYVGAPGAYSTVNTISNTLDPVLYQTNNQNTGLQYKFDVPNGSYQVTLKFSENYFTQPGQRVFSATANGTPVVSGLDLVDVAGPNTAYDVTFLLTVSGGLIDIAFQTGIDAPMVNAIQVMGVLPQCTQTNTPTISPTFTVSRTFSSSPSSTISATHTPSPTRSATFTISPTFSRSPSFTLSPTISATATPTPFVTATATPTSFAIPPCAYVKRINGGGPAYTDSAGNPWAADQPYAAGGFGYVGAGSFCSGSPIAGTADPVLYQCEHESASLEYKFSVPNGNYLVTMKFAELWFTAVNQRVFTVFAQGVAVIPNLDIVAQAGPLAAYDQTFMVTVSTGILDLTALAAVNTPLVSAIQVIGMASLCTPTPTSTPSPSPSPTPSETLSFTRTPSPTPSFSPTATATWTPSSSPSASPTATPTLTWTPTATPSPTPSVTRTQTPSVTVTFLDTYTSSPTVTPTPSVTLTASPSPSITPTGTGSATPTPSPTATMTASPTLSGTPTLTLSPQDTPSSSPTATPSGTPTLTPTISPTPTMTPSSTPTFSATLSFTRSPSPTASWTHTKSVTPSPLFSAEMQVFNSAGELVATLARGLRSYASPTGLRALGGAFIPDDGSAADFMLEGPNTVLSWDGANSQGQLVSAGIYRVLVVIKDPFGRVTSFSAPASVVRQPQSVELGIYNSAGELVRHFSRAAGSPDAGSMLLIPERVLLLGGPGGSPPAKLAIRYGTQAGDQFLWDGMNAAGIPVQAGTYTVRMAKPQSGGTVVMTGSVTVLASAAPDQGPLMAVPNPLRPGQALRILYPPCGACRVQARLYNMAGEAVASGQAGGGAGSVGLDSGRLASGAYIAELSIEAAGSAPRRRLLKLAVIQ